jgi:hypothetical protein
MAQTVLLLLNHTHEKINSIWHIEVTYLSDYCVQLQVETFAQFGVVFLLFALGLEFSLTKVLKKSLDVVLSPIYLFPKYFWQVYMSKGFLTVPVISISWKSLVLLLYLEACFRLLCSCSCVASLQRYIIKL